MSPLGLKLGATALTLASLVGSTGFVAGHIKNATAPLHPAIVRFGETPPPTPTPTPRTRLHLQPNVRTADDQRPLTFTYVS